LSKNIVFCADGTWNGPGDPDHDDKAAPATNVFKLFLNLDGKDDAGSFLLEKEQERALSGGDGSLRQIAKYLDGVGDSANFLVKLLGGTLGAGLITRIVRGYTFISRNYAAGDNIFIIGFSRGAYTARALAGMIAAKGLLAPGATTDKTDAYRLGAAVWYAYRHTAAETGGGWLDHLENLVLDLPGFFTKPPRADQLVAAPIAAVAVWDTVGSLGIPEYNRAMVRLDVFQFADRKLSTIVQRGLQAIAVDERRGDFTPTFWDAAPRITQVLFPGAHADVGGGYAATDGESGLSDRTLRWMTDEIAKLGVLFAAEPTCVPHPDPAGPAHQPWLHAPWNALPQAARSIPAGFNLAQFILDRMATRAVVPDPGSAACAYVPGNLGAYLAGTAAAPGIVMV
jgi:uncharacterized protein (DUF2235 family)